MVAPTIFRWSSRSASICKVLGWASDLVIEQNLKRSLKCDDALTRGRGFDENVSNLWTMSICYFAGVHETIHKLSGFDIGITENNKEMGIKRLVCDYELCELFYE